MTAGLERVVQWYPGHMARAMRRIGEYLQLDRHRRRSRRRARAAQRPQSGARRDMAGKRARILVLDARRPCRPRDDQSLDRRLSRSAASKRSASTAARSPASRASPSCGSRARPSAAERRARWSSAFPTPANRRSSTVCCAAPPPKPKIAPASRASCSGFAWRPASN